ncbi:CHAT domain-containing protein [Ramlibacter humi]|uniref:CHAT domain-containing protein n=1 Tax=Ramlibacter humi TaxID=2530451 RepID=A0A4Z0BG86_9BURK|nr:CHAT domain-containing protein [Ramlibacter humi]TFY97741.1 CHAT domain-containing protein [Ramlibacter humi]
MRTITLELLRHGPSHNQLLSPLTPYLALCDNHAPVTVNIPFEHNQFLHRLTALTYEFGDSRIADEQRKFQLQDTGRELSRILCAIPGLTAELNRHGEDSNEAIHLRLVLSASELALLPFELVLAGNGSPGFGQPLLLQNEAPVCLTRETRRVREPQLAWDADAKVLFVCASPPGLAPVPVDAHLLALRRAVDPWVGYFRKGDDAARRGRVEERLRVLTNATIDDIQAACAEGEYTHVHILAHGVTRPDGFDLRFGLALHAPGNGGGIDVAGGDRLASALRPLLKPGRDGFARPLVVTLASCNAANQGSVVGAGASIAHALQSAGIPLVIAGQFPLGFAGSVELVETLYDGLLWGADPRALLLDLRRRMHVLYPQRHDWAALTAYASLAPDFEQQLRRLQVERAQRALYTAMDHADSVLTEFLPAFGGRSDPPPDWTPAQKDQAFQAAVQRIEQPWQRMQRFAAEAGSEVEIRGHLASLAKRRAELVLLALRLIGLDEEEQARRREECRGFLAFSRRMYAECFAIDRDAAWAAVQQACLSLLLEPQEQDGSQASPVAAGLREKEVAGLWKAAWFQSLLDAQGSDARAGWALGNLIELPLLAVLMELPADEVLGAGTGAGVRSEARWFAEAESRVDELVRRAGEFDSQDYSTYWQLQRYAFWFDDINFRFGRVVQHARALLARMPTPRRSRE